MRQRNITSSSESGAKIGLFRFILSAIATITAGSHLLGTGAWLIGQIFNDRTYITQYCYWMPTPLVVLCSVGLLIVFTAVILVKQGAQEWKKWWCLCAIMTALPSVMLAYECRVVNMFSPPQSSAMAIAGSEKSQRGISQRSGAGSLRIFAWNPATDYMDDFAERVTKVTFDIFALTNRPGHTKWSVLGDHVGGAKSMARFGRLTMISKYRIMRWGGTVLGIEGAHKRTTVWNSGGEVSQDKGEAMFIEVDTTALLGRTSIIWLVDLPSDPQLSRRIMFTQAGQKLSEFRGPIFVRNDANLDVPAELTDAKPGFPSFDLIAGDFNTPRGSWSIHKIVGQARSAHMQAGAGWNGTWRRDIPLLTIDQMFTGQQMRCTEYRILDMGAGNHRAHVATIEPVTGL